MYQHVRSQLKPTRNTKIKNNCKMLSKYNLQININHQNKIKSLTKIKNDAELFVTVLTDILLNILSIRIDEPAFTQIFTQKQSQEIESRCKILTFINNEIATYIQILKNYKNEMNDVIIYLGYVKGMNHIQSAPIIWNKLQTGKDDADGDEIKIKDDDKIGIKDDEMKVRDNDYDIEIFMLKMKSKVTKWILEINSDISEKQYIIPNNINKFNLDNSQKHQNNILAQIKIIVADMNKIKIYIWAKIEIILRLKQHIEYTC